MARRVVKLTSNNFNDFTIVKIPTIGEGNCFFHAVCASYYKDYKDEIFHGKPKSKRSIVRSVRDGLAESLTRICPDTGLTYYEKIANGSLCELGIEDPEHYSLESFRNQLLSNDPVGEVVYSYLSMVINKSIYILDFDNRDVYSLGYMPDENLNSIVLFYTAAGCHYELCGIEENGVIHTYFSPKHAFISAIRDRLLELKKN